jgi:hypothetical protein
MGAKLVTMTALKVVAFPGVRVYAYSRDSRVVLGILVTENVAMTTTLAMVTYKALFLDQVV